MANDLRLQVILQALDKATAPLRGIERGSKGAAAALKAARERMSELNAQQRAIDGMRQQQAAFAETSNKLKILRAQLDGMRQSGTATTRQIATQERAVAKQTAAYEQQRQALVQLRTKLTGLGVGNVAAAQARLAGETQKANAAIAEQTAKLQALAARQRQLDAIAQRRDRATARAGALAAAGAGALATGAAIGLPLKAMVGAYATQEDAASQLQSAEMLAGGRVSAEYERLLALAKDLGNRLPGSTTDFINMLTILRREGISSAAVLGGVGEAAAYLAVQMKMPVEQAASFAAQMQDATRTSERDMMGLMDVIQRTFYLGVDSEKMLAGFTRLSPVLSLLRKDGLGAATDLAPLLVMMTQTGMAGDAAGNAIRKVFQAGVDAKKLEKANDALKTAGAGFQLNFTDGAGNFAGIDRVFEQLQKLQGIKSDITRTGVMKALFGDDSETLQVVGTMMTKGLAGYEEIIAKMERQAALKERVDAQLKTLTNLWDAATGTFSNVMAAAGETIGDDLKQLTQWLGQVSDAAGKWIGENRELVAWGMRVAGVLAALYVVFGVLAIGAAAVFAHMAIGQFVFARLALSAGPLIPLIKGIGVAMLATGKAMLANPMFLAVAALGTAAWLLWQHWDKVSALFSGLPAKFAAAGRAIVEGLAAGITGALGLVRDAVSGAAGAAVDWFKAKLGIKSPSRVFLAAGGDVAAGAALGIQSGAGDVRRAALGLAGAAGAGAAAMSGAGAPRIDRRGPLATARGAAVAAPAAASGPITVTINAAPGMDPQAIARAVSAELDRRERARRSRALSALADPA